MAVWLAARAEMASTADFAASWSGPAATISSKGPRAPAAQAASWFCREPCRYSACLHVTCAYVANILYMCHTSCQELTQGGRSRRKVTGREAELQAEVELRVSAAAEV